MVQLLIRTESESRGGDTSKTKTALLLSACFSSVGEGGDRSQSVGELLRDLDAQSIAAEVPRQAGLLSSVWRICITLTAGVPSGKNWWVNFTSHRFDSGARDVSRGFVS
ncbi:hypothetical protein chiPu_0012516 [Chiloscyllium punctatum]|uniref:Uncharacterized protein n=1 Tax=Chiloscyllium punctatum TaxID=137246 RepID=A0A401SUK7_CHIPU|nr:hypothetical protein [Chiloscyllium punctatum]